MPSRKNVNAPSFLGREGRRALAALPLSLAVLVVEPLPLAWLFSVVGLSTALMSSFVFADFPLSLAYRLVRSGVGSGGNIRPFRVIVVF